MSVAVELVRKPGGWERFVDGRGELALAGVMEIDRGLGLEVFTEPELARLPQRLDAEELIVVDGAVWSGFPQLAFYIDDKPTERWEGQVLDVRLDLLREHGRALSAEAVAEATSGLRRVGPSVDIGAQVEAANLARAVEGLEAELRLLRDVFLFGRGFGWVQAPAEDGVGFDLLEVDW